MNWIFLVVSVFCVKLIAAVISTSGVAGFLFSFKVLKPGDEPGKDVPEIAAGTRPVITS